MSTFIGSLLKYLYYSKKCKNKDFFEYRDLVKYDFTPPKYFHSVCLYGNHKAVANLRNKKFNYISEYLEHGVCFINTPESARLLGYVKRGTVKTVYTYGPFRQKLIEEYLRQRDIKKNIVTVGPYILGAKNFHSQEELSKLKKQYGKILLVYPQHSIENVNIHYGISDLIQKINKHKQDFDNVFVCIYWKDIVSHPEYVERYLSAGFVVVCNGHRSDPQFLSRQKDLIMLSDMMITNGLGTHVGYSICLNKPVVYCSQNIQIKDEESQIVEDNDIKEAEHSFASTFSTYSFTITENQKEFVKYYWGDY